MRTTKYAGHVMDDGRINVIVTDTKTGEYHRIPHVECMENGMALLPIRINFENDYVKKYKMRYLTQHEVSCFMKGQNTDGTRAIPPSELLAKDDEEARKYYKTKEGKELIAKMKKESETNETIKEIYDFFVKKYGLTD